MKADLRSTLPATARRLACTGLVFVLLAGPVLRAQPVTPPSGPVQTGLPTDAPTQLFSFSADNLPLKQALALFARANKLNIIPDLDIDGTVTVDFQDLPLDLAMQSLLEAHGYYFTHEGRLLRVRNQETRLFRLNYIQSVRAGQGSNAVQISSGGGGNSGGGGSSGGSSGSGSGGAEGSTMTVTNTSTIDFWGSLATELKTMVSERGSFTINSLAGTILVRDSHRNVETVATYLADIEQSVGRQIELEVEIYEVTLGNSSQLGINWTRVEDWIDSTITTQPGVLSLPGGAGLIVQNPVYGGSVPLPGVRAAYSRGGVSAVLEALKQEGELKVVSKPRLRTLNNQPAVVRVGQDLPVFLREVTQSGSDTPVITVSESIQTVTVGTVLSITPQVAPDGMITLDVTPAVSRLVRMAISASGDTNAPVIDIRQASSIVRLRDGATVIMGGLVQDSSSTTKRKVPLLGDVPLLGRAFTGNYESKERTELIFVLTPRIVRDGEPSALPPGTPVAQVAPPAPLPPVP